MYLGQGEVPISIRVKLSKELPPPLLGLVGILAGQLPVDGGPVYVGHLDLRFCFTASHAQYVVQNVLPRAQV